MGKRRKGVGFWKEKKGQRCPTMASCGMKKKKEKGRGDTFSGRGEEERESYLSHNHSRSKKGVEERSDLNKKESKEEFRLLNYNSFVGRKEVLFPQ